MGGRGNIHHGGINLINQDIEIKMLFSGPRQIDFQYPTPPYSHHTFGFLHFEISSSVVGSVMY